MCAHARVHVCVVWVMWSLEELALSFHHVVPGALPPVVRLGRGCLYLLRSPSRQAWQATLQPQNLHLPSNSPNGWLKTDTRRSARVLTGRKWSLFFTHQAHPGQIQQGVFKIQATQPLLSLNTQGHRCLCFKETKCCTGFMF